MHFQDSAVHHFTHHAGVENPDVIPSFIKRDDQIFISWHNLEFSVPLLRADKKKVEA